ncbi:hypothetical protein NA57DRAFT_62806 [Rhizodiscina lignyota]|uniref:Uncharacterized protein n=1 Tax=Rhizodiscina lignyota TaxID=1504668 RepID=A0A9P4ITB3_9PEZI|nr:hypothetical protein NA57DRAFT_62806 [Rhizodiscina lignyota]
MAIVRHIPAGPSKAQEGALFPKTNAVVDGDDCLHDCASCTIKYPNKFSIDESEHLYGRVDGWSTHLVVATGKTDWVRDVADEKGSIMEAVDKFRGNISNGKLKLSASNMPIPDHGDHTSVLLLPSFTIIDHVTPKTVPDLISHFINTSSTNTTPLPHPATPFSSLTTPPLTPALPTSISSGLTSRPCPHNYLILLCSQKTRDARCGQSAPLLRREFERHLRPLGLYRDLHDERPGGVGIYFISHVGGHKFSANVIIYRREGAAGAGPAMNGSVAEVEEGAKEDGEEESNGTNGQESKAEEVNKEAAQCIWLARVRPEDCENIVRYTILQGKLVKPERQLRGGFDRCKGLVSW